MYQLPIVAVPVGNQYGLNNEFSESNIVSLSYDQSGLRIVLETNPKGSFDRLNLEYLFKHTRGFRILDELDIYRYWNNEIFSSNHHLYELQKGGWLEQETQFSGMMSNPNGIREWFIRTSNLCANIFAPNIPLIREL